ncbi:MAG: response regulator [Planctomycetes bacterium]|nr:response regulator [Planctomycetota bacterium]
MAKTVMFIDDDDAFLHIVRRVCSGMGSVADVLTALNGSEALTGFEQLLAAESTLPDMVFVDINMPVMDGFAFLTAFAALREHDPRLQVVRPVAMLTSSDQERDRDRAAALGADDYLVKGVGLTEIREAIGRFLA